jgi:hypothetical protein
MRPAQTLKGCIRWSKKYGRRRRESNPCTGLCRPLPKPLGHSAIGASFAGGRHAASQGCGASPGELLRFLTETALAVSRANPKPRFRADDGIRTRDPHLGKVMLYQLSHVRMPVREYLGPARRISPASRQNFIRSWLNHQLEPGIATKNLSLQRVRLTLSPQLSQVSGGVRRTSIRSGSSSATPAGRSPAAWAC